MDCHSYLNSFNNFESHLNKVKPQQFNLDRIIQLLDALDNPQLGLRIIHVAGTKGKGSTCAMISSILQEADYKVGLFTSPHLFCVNERIRILTKNNDEEFSGSISDQHLEALINQTRTVIDTLVSKGIALTYFEVLTALALVYFAANKVDIVVLETGLGGRFDATNAVDSHIAVITPISFDHQHLLGKTLAAIAGEKAAIIKDKYQQVIIAPQEQEAGAVIDKHCEDVGVIPRHIDGNKALKYQLRLKGKHQVINASVAIGVIDALREQGIAISEQAVSDGFKKVYWPGRFEIISQQPTIIIDGAHNAASARALCQTLNEEYPDHKKIMVVAISNDKDIKGIVDVLKNNAAHLIFSKANHPRSFIFNEENVIPLAGQKTFSIIDDLAKAIGYAVQLADTNKVVVITGSIFTIAQARKLCTNTNH